jgi:alkaline phosphatase
MPPMAIRLLSLLLLSVFSFACSSPKPAGSAVKPAGSVVFLHPDGAGLSAWEAYRYLAVGPDGRTNYDRLPEMATYHGHMSNALTATSNGGATAHALGVRVGSDSFGNDDGVTVKGSRSWLQEARDRGLPIGIVNSGTITEPGTACFVTDVPKRNQHDEIAAQVVASGAAVILGGGEQWFLPTGVAGRHGPGVRKDSRNLVDEAKAKGYVVVYTAAELAAVSPTTPKVLGLFASVHTFNDEPEEKLAETARPLYKAGAPTLAEMTRFALASLQARGKVFALVVEEEGSDNFGNNNNAPGMLEALRRTDETIAVINVHIAAHPRTMMMTTCDSDAGGMRAVGGKPEDFPLTLPARDRNGAPLDGVSGTASAPFLAAPDRTGRQLPFAIAWATLDDCSGGIAVKATGYRSELVTGHMDNTDIARLARTVLFGQVLSGRD